jgi:alkylation response protein AidB-like acyl-CoA dehydrogenase
MDFSWSDDQLAYKKSVIDFARNELNPSVSDGDDPTFSRALWMKCANFGILGLPVPEAYGGSGADVLTTMLAMEALGYGCRDNGLLFSIQAQMWSVQMPILKFGTPAQRELYLPKLCDGTLIGAHGMTEPDSGSDSFSLRTRAVRQGDRYTLNGTKTFATNAPIADLIVAFATVDKKKGMWGLTGFLIPRETPGLSIGRKISKMGLTSSPMAELAFDNCEVPATSVLGREGQGSAIFNHSMGWERSCILASTVGAMDRQLEACARYAQERRQFGRPIGSFQLVASRLVDMRVRLETSRLLLYHAAWSHARGAITPTEAAVAKLYISESAVASSLDAVQIHGGYGYTKEFGIERDLRDSIAGRIYSGTSEIQRLIIARGLGVSAEQ